MSDSPDTASKTKLLGVLGDAQASNAAARERAQEMAESFDFAEGLARHTRRVIEQVPNDSALPADMWGDLTRAWEEQTRLTTSVFNVISAAPSSSATTAAATLTTTGSTEILSGWVSPSEELQALRSYVHRPNRIEMVRGLARIFRLDGASHGSRSPLQLLEEASAALARPVGDSPAPTAVLVSAREAVQLALADLLRRRPRQEPAAKAADKVSSLGLQCGRPHLATDHFERLGRDLARLLDRLSVAKTGVLSRRQVSDLFDEVLQFFEAFLRSLDSTALK